jgi:hypothetical protein
MFDLSAYQNLLTRRSFFSKSACGIGTAALATLLQSSGHAESAATNVGIHFPARAKRIIYLFPSGGPPQMETFDYKPRLKELHLTELPKSVQGDQRLTVFQSLEPKKMVIAPPWNFHQYGESGAWVCELFPHLASVVDDICFIKSMNTEAVNHDPGQTMLMTGSQQPGRPSLGGWLSYGLGSENQNLPAFVVLMQPSRIPDASAPISSVQWGTGFLPSSHQGVKFRASGEPVLYLNNPPGIDAQARREMLDASRSLNELEHRQFGDPEILSRVAQFELAFRMQSAVPALADLSNEPEHVFEMYGPQAKVPGSYAANCLMARRLAEAGVRYVQVIDRDWDHHRNAKRHMPRKAGEFDQPTAALLTDLKQRGLLEDTLVVCSGEFGRSVYSQEMKLTDNYGRDHHGRCFTSWMAGAGVKAGQSIGRTDDYAFNVVEDPVHIHDFNATILHLAGIDHRRLTYRFQGRDHRLTDVHGNVVTKALA